MNSEVVVIGGGPGGYVAAIRGGQLGLDVTVVEMDALGGVCLNRGCIPSKALLSATAVVDSVREAESMGIQADPTVDFGVMRDWQDGIVDDLTTGIDRLCKANGVEYRPGQAKFVDGRTLEIHGGDSNDDPTELEFEKAIIATGSRPISIPGFDYTDAPVMDAAGALDRQTIPDRLVVIGAGYIGMELSTVFARLGSDVLVIEALDSILPGWDDALTRPVKARADELGIDFVFGEAAEGWQTSDSTDGIVVETDSGETYPGEAVLVAVGREPVTETLALDRVELSPDEGGYLRTDQEMRTERDHIFAVGDVAGEPMLAHKASAEGEVAAAVIAGQSARLDERSVPAVVYTDPEIATVGQTAAEVNAAGQEPVVGEFPLRASGRAKTLDRSDGIVRLIAEDSTGMLRGGHIVGEHASELIAEIGLAIDTGTTIETVAETIHAHPTLSESVMEAAKQGRGRAIHTLNR